MSKMQAQSRGADFCSELGVPTNKDDDAGRQRKAASALPFSENSDAQRSFRVSASGSALPHILTRHAPDAVVSVARLCRPCDHRSASDHMRVWRILASNGGV